MGFFDLFDDDLEIDGEIDDMEFELEQYRRKRKKEDEIVFGDLDGDLFDDDSFEDYDE